MKALGYEVSAESAAPPERVFGLLEDAPGWSRWAGPFVRWSAWQPGRGTGEPGGVGWVRLLGTPRLHSREEIVAHERNRMLAYEVRAGFPVRGYRAEVTLEPAGADGNRTLIRWAGRFEPLVPLTGAVMVAFTRRLVGSFARRLAAAAESEGPGPADSRPGHRRDMRR